MVNWGEKMEKSTVILEEVKKNIKRINKTNLLKIENNKNSDLLIITDDSKAVDVFKIRVQRDCNTTGNISVLDAPRLYKNILRLLYVSAADIKNPKKYHKGNYAEQFNEYISKCQFGQTEVGSYVVKLYLPLEADIDQEGDEPLFEEDCYRESMGRQISNKIMKSLNTIKTAIDEKNEKRLVDDFTTDNISGNMYEAIAGLTLDNEKTLVEVSAEWASVAPNEECECSHVTFTDDYYGPLCQVSEKLKQDTKYEINIVGYVGGVKATSDYTKRTKGNVSIDYFDREEEKKHSLNVTLNIEDYNLATEAHQKGYQVKFVGKRDAEGNVICTSFEIIDSRYANNASQGTLF